MLSSISWWMYLKVLSVLLLIYYLSVLGIYFRSEGMHLFALMSRQSTAGPKSDPAPVAGDASENRPADNRPGASGKLDTALSIPTDSGQPMDKGALAEPLRHQSQEQTPS